MPSPVPQARLFALLCTLMQISCRAHDAQLWSTTTEANEWDQLDERSGAVLGTVKCSGCGHGTVQRKAAVDRVDSTYYTIRLKDALGIGHIELHGFDITSGKIVSEVKLPQFTKFAGGFGTGIWGIAVDDTPQLRGDDGYVPRLLVFGPTGKKGAHDHTLFEVFPRNGTVSQLADPTDMFAYDNSDPAATFDASTGAFYTLYSNSYAETAVRGFDARTGTTVFDRNITEFPAVYTLDAYEGGLFAVGLDFTKTGQYRNLIRIDPKSAALEVLANLTDYMENLPATAVEHLTGKLACMLLPMGAQSANLVTIDLKTREVLAQPQLCEQYDMCPATLGYL